MSWDEFISHVVITSAQVDKMAVYDLKGRPVAVTKDLETCESEGMALIRCVLDPNKTLTKLYIDQEPFVCIQGIDKTLIGRSDKTPGIIIAAYHVLDHVIIAVGKSAGNGSFIVELKQGLHLMAQGKLVNQHQFEQQIQLQRQQQQKQQIQLQLKQKQQQQLQHQQKQMELKQLDRFLSTGSGDEEAMVDLVNLFCDSIDRARLINVFPQKST